MTTQDQPVPRFSLMINRPSYTTKCFKQFVPLADAILCCCLFLSSCHHRASQLDSKDRKQHFRFVVVAAVELWCPAAKPGQNVSNVSNVSMTACSNHMSEIKTERKSARIQFQKVLLWWISIIPQLSDHKWCKTTHRSFYRVQIPYFLYRFHHLRVWKGGWVKSRCFGQPGLQLSLCDLYGLITAFCLF